MDLILTFSFLLSAFTTGLYVVAALLHRIQPERHGHQPPPGHIWVYILASSILMLTASGGFAGFVDVFWVALLALVLRGFFWAHALVLVTYEMLRLRDAQRSR